MKELDVTKFDARVAHAQRVERELQRLREYGGLPAVQRALAIHKTSPLDIFDAIEVAKAEVATDVRRAIADTSGRTLAEVFTSTAPPQAPATPASPNRHARRRAANRKKR